MLSELPCAEIGSRVGSDLPTLGRRDSNSIVWVEVEVAIDMYCDLARGTETYSNCVYLARQTDEVLTYFPYESSTARTICTEGMTRDLKATNPHETE